MIHLDKFLIILSILIISCYQSVSGTVRYHCREDSVKVMDILKAAGQADSYGGKVAAAAKAMRGIPFGKAADNDSIGTIVIRLDSINQREFINIALAAAKTAQLSVPTLREFEKYLENVSRRKGQDEGFASQFFYGADWIVDNVFRGNLKEMTEYLEAGNYRTKTLDYVSRHPEQFPALADSATMDKIKVIEFGYRSHRIPHLKKQTIGNKGVKELLKDGDIILLSPPDADFDIYDIGIISMENGEPTLVHISREKEEVVLDPYPVSRLFKIESQFFYGYRWLRPEE